MSSPANAAEREVVLTVPFDMEELDTIRLTLYGVAVRMGFSYEAIEDMKVALTEACNYALLQSGQIVRGAASLRFTFFMRPQELLVRMEAPGSGLSLGEAKSSRDKLLTEAEEGERPLFESGQLGLYMMQALVDEVRVITAGEGPQAEEAIELLKRLG